MLDKLSKLTGSSTIEPNNLGQYGRLLIYAYCCVAALSIALSQMLILPLLFIWIAIIRQRQATLSNADNTSTTSITIALSKVTHIVAAISTWLFLCLISSILGVDTSTAIFELLKTSLYMLFPFCVCTVISESKTPEERISCIVKLLFLLICSQTCAALHTLISLFIDTSVIPRIPGDMTESGQLVLVIPIALALYQICYHEKSHTLKVNVLWVNVMFAVLIAALIANLKRGPWLGVFVEIIILSAVISRKLLLWTIGACAIAFLLFQPVRDRVVSFEEHFNIAGGRKYMWSLGVELAERYPLGVGLDNAKHMHVLDPTLPKLHRHMHNNFLNVIVESGWLGLAAYLWLMLAIVMLSIKIWLKHKNSFDNSLRAVSMLSLNIGIAIIGWQTAGLVEYNFGDGEIRLIALLYVGILLALNKIDNRSQG